MDKTVRELAQELGITVQAVYARLRKLAPEEREATTYKSQNRTYIRPEGQDLIRDQGSQARATEDGQEPPEGTSTQDLIRALKQENAFLKDQIKIKDEQINTASILAAQAQQALQLITARLPAGNETDSGLNHDSKDVKEVEHRLNNDSNDFKAVKARPWRRLRDFFKKGD